MRMEKIKIAIIGIILGFGLPMIITSCSDTNKDIIEKKSLGLMKVEEVKSVNSKICDYKISGDGITLNGYFNIECECGKFNANERLELKVINEKKIELKEKFLIIDEEGNVTIAKTNETELKNIINELKNVKKHYQEELSEQDIIIEKYKFKLDSLNKVINGKK